MSPLILRRPFHTLVLVGVTVVLSGCGGGEPQTVPAGPARDAGNAGVKPPSPPTTASSSSRRRDTPKSSAPLLALPEGAARYFVVPADEDGANAEPANFVLTGQNRGPADAVRVQAVVPPEGDSSRFTIAAVPDPPGGVADMASPPGFEIVRSAGVGPGGLPWRMRSTVDGMIVCLVPAGLVHLGAEDGERPRAFVGGFYIDEHEVTVGQFRAFLEQSGERTEPPTNLDADADLPAVGLPWRSAFLYAKWAGRALPTEAEWVRAARGDHDFRYPWGHSEPVFGGARGFNEITPVMSYRTDRSPFGVFDLAGNAGEWTVQTYADELLRGERADASGLYRNPDRGSGAGGAKTVRGLGDGWTPERRTPRDAQTGVERVGFRCVWRLTVDGTPGGDPLPSIVGGAET